MGDRRPRSGLTDPSINSPASIGARLRALETPLRFLKGVGPARAARLEKFGLRTVEDLLFHLPFRYEDRRQTVRCADARVGESVGLVGRLARVRARFNPHLRAHHVDVILRDESGSLSLVWYRAPRYLVEKLAPGETLRVFGRIEAGAGGEKRMIHPEFEVVRPDSAFRQGEIVPVYERPGEIPLGLLRKWVGQALADFGAMLPDTVPAPALRRRALLPIKDALARLHRPEPEMDVDSLNAFTSREHRSVVFDELFHLQLGLLLRKRARSRTRMVVLDPVRREYTGRMRSLLPFRLTGAQERVLEEIQRDFQSGHAMQRLVQGDVGSGKTMVAWMASLYILERGRQVVWMAPTELLAEQHFASLRPFVDALGIRSALLSGALAARQRSRILSATAGGEIDFVIGTHAVIQQGVRVPRLGLGFIDEQHRFGVLQRLSLRRLSGDSAIAEEPHLLLMSATPIPRSLAMVLYGDLDVSMLDEMPPGRTPVTTRVFQEHERREVYGTVIAELRRGHQAFIVYPLVEASDQLREVRDATQMAARMRAGAFRDYRVGLLHGRMTPDERDATMRAFRDGQIQILVCTTVIEVGIDVPNATVMVVEHADRFGLSQLHQLRGRIGRGAAPGACLLINRAPANPLAAERLKVMERERDGFKIAEADLALRGPGELLGTRQSGVAELRSVNLMRDAQTLFEAREEAEALLESDPALRSEPAAATRAVLLHRWGTKLQLGAVG